MKYYRIITLVFCFLYSTMVSIHAQGVYSRDVQPTLQNKVPKAMKGVDIGGKLGVQIPLNIMFKDENGQDVNIGKYFDGKKPVLFNFAYHSCPMLCHFVLDGIVKGAKQFSWTPSKEYEIVTVSIMPSETPELAAKQKVKYLARLGKPGAENGWHFLTGKEENIRALADAIGFKYRWDEETKQYSHAAAIMLLSGEGKLSRYLYGISYSGNDIRNGLIEASEGKVGNTAEKIFLWCYHFDPQEGKYVMSAMRVMQIGAGFVLIFIIGGLFYYWRRERTSNGNDWDEVLKQQHRI